MSFGEPVHPASPELPPQRTLRGWELSRRQFVVLVGTRRTPGGHGAAERFDVLLRPPAPGQYRITVALQHWLSSADIATRVIPITVA